MKKLLYTTSALVGAAFLMEAVVPAKAEVNVSLRYRAALMSQSKKDADKDKDISDGEKDRATTLASNLIHLTFDGSKDHPNGLTTSAFFQLETRDNSATGREDAKVEGGQADGVRFKNAFGSIGGSFGKVDVGYFHDVAYRTLGYGTPGTANFGVSDAWNQPAGVFINPSATGSLGGRSSSIAYWSPSFSGAQVGVSWAPQMNKNGRNSGFVSKQDDLEDSIAFVASYSGSFGGTGVSMGVGMEQAKIVSKKGESYVGGDLVYNTSTAATAMSMINADNSEVTADDFFLLLNADNALQVAASSASGGTATALGVSRQNQDPSAFTGYISFDIGQFTVGGSYSAREQEAANAASTSEHTIIALGASYTVDAMTFGIGYAQQDTETTHHNVRKGTFTTSGATAAEVKASSPFKQDLSKDVLAFTVDYQLGDGAAIDFVIEQATAESTALSGASASVGKKETDTSGFGIGLDLKF